MDVKSSISPSCAHPLNNPQLEYSVNFTIWFHHKSCMCIYICINLLVYRPNLLCCRIRNIWLRYHIPKYVCFISADFYNSWLWVRIFYKCVHKLCTQQLIFLFCIVTLSSQQQGYICQMLAYQHLSYIGMVHFVNCWCNHNWYPYRQSVIPSINGTLV